jgi:plasmid stabilization system protein ParE
MYTVIFSKGADKEIISIVKHVAAENPEAAKKLGSSLLDLALSLDSMHYRGSKVKKRRGVLKLIHGNYLTSRPVDAHLPPGLVSWLRTTLGQ